MKYTSKLILNWEEYQFAAPSGWWQPWANTMAYLPLKWNLTDLAWNYTWTSWANLQWDTTVADIPVAYVSTNDWYAYTTTNWPTIDGSNSYTVSWWVKLSDVTKAMSIIDIDYWTYRGLAMTKFYDGAYKQYFIIYLWWYSWSSGIEYLYTYNPWTNWNLYTATYSPWNIKWYINGSLVSQQSVTLSWSISPTSYISIGKSNKTQSTYYSDILFEQSEKSAQEISDYYNQTKSLYGIS